MYKFTARIQAFHDLTYFNSLLLLMHIRARLWQLDSYYNMLLVIEAFAYEGGIVSKVCALSGSHAILAFP